MPQNTAFILTRITNDEDDHTDPQAPGPSARTLSAAIKDAATIATRARVSGKIYADSILLGSQRYRLIRGETMDLHQRFAHIPQTDWPHITQEFWTDLEGTTGHPEFAPPEIRNNCWNTTDGLIRDYRLNPTAKPTCVLTYTGKMLKTMGKNTIKELSQNPGHIVIQVDYQ